MSTCKSLLQRWWRPLLFVAWIWALTGLLKNERYTAFLRPEFGYVLGVGVFTLLGFLVTGMAEARPRRFGIPQALHVLILLLPLAYLWNAQGASLDAYAFQNRSLGLPSVEMPGNEPRPDASASHAVPNSSAPRKSVSSEDRREAERIAKSDPSLSQGTTDPQPTRQVEKRAGPSAIPPDPDDLAATSEQPEEQLPGRKDSSTSLPDPGPVERTAVKEGNVAGNPERVQSPPVARTPVEESPRGQATKDAPQAEAGKTAAPAKAVSILDLYSAPRIYEGKRVKLMGMLHKNDAQVKKDFGRDLLVVFRFVITCCAADAMPSAVLVDGEDMPDLPESAWVEAEGIFTLHEKNGRRVPILEKSSIKKIDPPKQKYLF